MMILFSFCVAVQNLKKADWKLQQCLKLFWLSFSKGLNQRLSWRSIDRRCFRQAKSPEAQCGWGPYTPKTGLLGISGFSSKPIVCENRWESGQKKPKQYRWQYPNPAGSQLSDYVTRKVVFPCKNNFCIICTPSKFLEKYFSSSKI